MIQDEQLNSAVFFVANLAHRNSLRHSTISIWFLTRQTRDRIKLLRSDLCARIRREYFGLSDVGRLFILSSRALICLSNVVEEGGTCCSRALKHCSAFLLVLTWFSPDLESCRIRVYSCSSTSLSVTSVSISWSSCSSMVYRDVASSVDLCQVIWRTSVSGQTSQL